MFVDLFSMYIYIYYIALVSLLAPKNVVFLHRVAGGVAFYLILQPSWYTANVRKMICTNENDCLGAWMMNCFYMLLQIPRKVYETPELIYLLMTQGAYDLLPHLLICSLPLQLHQVSQWSWAGWWWSKGQRRPPPLHHLQHLQSSVPREINPSNSHPWYLQGWTLNGRTAMATSVFQICVTC